MQRLPCKLWQKTTSPDGYGREWYQEGRVYKQAHRLAYCRYHGITLESIDGQLLRHTCDVRNCVEPTHLLLGTPADNSADMVERDRQATGADNGNSALQGSDVLYIRANYRRRCKENGGPALARLFGITTTTVSNIVNRRQWRHI